jgi:hypothetical protein
MTMMDFTLLISALAHLIAALAELLARCRLRK